ncbi:hypothetical protein KVR01_005419 [Diaporthe batatas]|uniref:uncharacterized protein n=1 Tax=Diaporthe batatas TaxID=748121 RepID=UPI001D0553FF|nr:uncharacterized protein KVR01_005419 [Diaporthe batatas]KAG8165144.1 hypothetical protein KVR01_005419 [Diaporthe batatas]
MGSVGVDEQGLTQADAHPFKHYSIEGLFSPSETCLPTALRADILLTSWLIVLMRTKEERQASFEWAYDGWDDDAVHQRTARCLSTDEVLPGLDLDSSLADAIQRTSRSHASGVKDLCTETSCPNHLLLSTGSLSTTSNDEQDEGAIHLEVRLDDGRLAIRPAWYSEKVLPYTLALHMDILVDIVEMCLSNPGASIQSCMTPTKHDLDSIWRWCHNLPATHDFCMQEMVAEQAKRHADKVAIDAWDGALTYGQIEQYSTYLAGLLRDSGVETHDFVPLCFEKSRWTIVAVLAVMKAGATIAMMDPSLPLGRLQNMAVQVGAKIMVSSRLQHDLGTNILPEGPRFVVEEEAFATLTDSSELPTLPAVPPTALMYIIFTSGSTGTPKGVKISHRTYTSSAIPRAAAVGYSEESRVLDFASYAFDVSIDSMLLTLGNGGTLCIPSDEDRLNDINGVMRQMRINYAGITPSVARILEPDVIASLTALGLGGEASAPRDVNMWGRETRIVIGYGPCECTIGCTVNSSAATGRDYISIGPGNGASIWIVDPNDHDVLVPVGAVGELLVEGPIVGQGYLNDDEKTTAAFIHDPPWLLAGHKSYHGRRGRLYKTGDLGMYDPDGSGEIVFAGRKDTQVKLRGQRVELGEIESQLKASLPSDANVIAEVIVPQASGGQPTLVAFVSQLTKVNGVEELEAAQLSADLTQALSGINTILAKVLPRYMVPNAYIPVSYIPTLISGKIDRKRLRQFGATVDLQKLDQGPAAKTTRESRDLDDIEQCLRHAWSLVLKVAEDSIHPQDNFFSLGGESLAAMKLVSVCRERGLDLSVTSTFSHPTLEEMAETVRIYDVDVQTETPPFSLISQSLESACVEAAQACGTDPEAVEDIYPCTPTQESLITFSLKSTEPYVAQRIACIPSNLSLDAFKQAWESVFAANPILRTRVAQLQDPGLQQVVLKQAIDWRHSTSLPQYLEADRNERMDLGQSLARYGIVEDESDGNRYMVWTVHHVQYDGWSEPLILDMVSRALENSSIVTQPKALMKDFVKWVHDTDQNAMQDFWRNELEGAIGPQFPATPSRDYLPTPNGTAERLICLDKTDGLPFTIATLIRGAWALVASQYTGSDDVVFGETLTGRDISLRGVEDVLGPMNATVPVRVRIDRAASAKSYLAAVQQAMSSRTPYQHMGMQYIRRVSRDAQHACEAPTGIVVQPEPELVGGALGFGLGDPVREALHFNPYPLMLAFGLRKGGFRVCASFDKSLVDVAQMERVLAQLEAACLRLTEDLDRKVGQVSCMPEEELDQIWRWNQTAPLAPEEATGRFRANGAIKPGSQYPRVANPWVCDPRNPSHLTPIGCQGELWLESAVLTEDVVETPAWLIAGSSEVVGRAGKVQPTGDIVQLRPDGNLLFVGRRDDVMPLSGHAINVADLEAHCARLLPQSARAAAAVFQPVADGKKQAQDQELVILIEQQPQGEKSVELMFMSHDISCDEADPDSFRATIYSEIPVSLAMALKKLDKFIRDDLPSSLQPSAYVVVDKLPLENGHVDRAMLNTFASGIASHVLGQLRDGYNKVWETLGQANLSASEDILRSAWAKLLCMRPEQIDVDDNFFRLGGDSVLAMKLVSGLRAQGHGLSVADVFQHMRLGDAARVLKVNSAPAGKALPYKPFSTLGVQNVDQFLADVVRPKLAVPSWSIKDAAPVTDSQALDIRGTVQAPRTSVQYTMLHFEQAIDQWRLADACKDLVKTHDILRTVFIEHESTYFQIILDEINIALTTQSADDGIDEAVNKVCTEDIETDFALGSSFFKLFHVEGNDGNHCLVIRLSHALYDGMSLPRLLEDLETLYSSRKVGDFEPFPSYIARSFEQSLQTKALSYWRDLLQDSSLTVLEGQTTEPADRGVFKEDLAIENFRVLAEITTANLLTAAWALLLARRTGTSDVTFGGVTSGRGIDMAGVENVVGPCYQMTPIRVPFEPTWTAADLLRFVQRQSGESAAHDFVGFAKISRECTRWSGDGATPQLFFDSIVHHQDWDDADSMPFAGTTARLEISNPHGDAPRPLKAVSFVKEGHLRVGVVGSERDAKLVGSLLAELVAAVQELASPGGGQIVLGADAV